MLSYYYTDQTHTQGCIRELTGKHPREAGVRGRCARPSAVRAEAAVRGRRAGWNAAGFSSYVREMKPYPCRELAMWSDMKSLSTAW